MKKRFFKAILFITTLSIGGSIISGCGGKTNKVSEQIETKYSSEYPIKTDNKLTWATWTTSHSDYLNYKDQPFFKGLIDQTGVDIDFKFDVVNDSFNLMVASGELPDIIQNDWYGYKGGPQQAIDEGIILDLTDYINKWAPNLKKYLNEHPDIDKDVKTDNGSYYAFPMIRGDEYLCVCEGAMVRSDLLDKFNLNAPETIDEWENMLNTFKNNGIKVPLCLGDSEKPFTGAYNVTNEFYRDGDTVKYGPIEDGYKKYVELMNKWFKSGLLDPDYGTVSRQIQIGKVTSGEVGATVGFCGSTMGVCLSAGKSNNPEFDLMATKYPVVNKGDYPEFGQFDNFYTQTSTTAITPQCKDIELAVRVLDYAYSEKGHMLYNFGIEGESYEMVDGYPKFTDEIYNYENGDITASLKRYVASVDHAPCVQDKRMYEQRLIFDEQKKAIDTWAQTNMKNHILPHITANSEESELMSDVYTNIKTYVLENTKLFIYGKRPMSEYDDFVNTIKEMGIEDVLKAKQTQYKRYMER